MAQYIDGDKLLEYYEERHKNLCKKNGETDAYCQGYEDAMYVAEHIDFAADVVPKSEVDLYRKQVDELEDELASTYDKLENAKAEIETLKDNNEHLAVILEETKIELKAMRGAANSYKMHYEKAEAEVERLHGILLQFTDIVHKWGAKNNIDTSEISLVPILQEEADSIIKKANQELQKEIDLLKSTITHKEEEAYTKGYADAKADILEKLQAEVERAETIAKYGDDFYEGKAEGVNAAMNCILSEGEE